MFFVHAFFIIKALKILSVKNKYDVDYKYVMLFLISLSIVRLLFSYTLWREQGYWIIMAFVLNSKYYLINESDIVNSNISNC